MFFKFCSCELLIGVVYLISYFGQQHLSKMPW